MELASRTTSKNTTPLSLAPSKTVIIVEGRGRPGRRTFIPGLTDVFIKGQLFEVYAYRAGTAAIFWCWMVSFALDIWGLLSEDKDQWSPRNIAAQTFSLVVILDTAIRLIFKTSILSMIAAKHLKQKHPHYLPNDIIRLQAVWFVSLNIVAAVARRVDMWILATCMTGLQWSTALVYAWFYFCPICFLYGLLLRYKKFKLDADLVEMLEQLNQERCKFTSIGPNLHLTELPAAPKKVATSQESKGSVEDCPANLKESAEVECGGGHTVGELKESAEECPATPTRVSCNLVPLDSISCETPRT